MLGYIYLPLSGFREVRDRDLIAGHCFSFVIFAVAPPEGSTRSRRKMASLFRISLRKYLQPTSVTLINNPTVIQPTVHCPCDLIANFLLNFYFVCIL